MILNYFFLSKNCFPVIRNTAKGNENMNTDPGVPFFMSRKVAHPTTTSAISFDHVSSIKNFI